MRDHQADWRRVLREAERLGVVQVNFTGGEPLLRSDLEALIAEARSLDLYSNLITSGIPLERERLERLRRLGLDNVQVSIQDARPDESDRIAGREAFHRKLEVARWVKELGFPLTVNTVLHRQNLERIGEVIALAEELHADRLELANTQYLGWAHRNRAALLPTQAQLEGARSVAAAARARLEGRMEVVFVVPDYYARFPLRAWTAGAGASWSSRPTGCFSPVCSRTRCPDFLSGTSARVRSRSCGRPRPAWWPSAASPGCRSRAGAASGDRSILAGAAARPSN